MPEDAPVIVKDPDADVPVVVKDPVAAATKAMSGRNIPFIGKVADSLKELGLAEAIPIATLTAADALSERLPGGPMYVPGVVNVIQQPILKKLFGPQTTTRPPVAPTKTRALIEYILSTIQSKVAGYPSKYEVKLPPAVEETLSNFVAGEFPSWLGRGAARLGSSGMQGLGKRIFPGSELPEVQNIARINEREGLGMTSPEVLQDKSLLRASKEAVGRNALTVQAEANRVKNLVQKGVGKIAEATSGAGPNATGRQIVDAMKGTEGEKLPLLTRLQVGFGGVEDATKPSPIVAPGNIPQKLVASTEQTWRQNLTEMRNRIIKSMKERSSVKAPKSAPLLSDTEMYTALKGLWKADPDKIHEVIGLNETNGLRTLESLLKRDPDGEMVLNGIKRKWQQHYFLGDVGNAESLKNLSKKVASLDPEFAAEMFKRNPGGLARLRELGQVFDRINLDLVKQAVDTVEAKKEGLFGFLARSKYHLIRAASRVTFGAAMDSIINSPRAYDLFVHGLKSYTSNQGRGTALIIRAMQFASDELTGSHNIVPEMDPKYKRKEYGF